MTTTRKKGDDAKAHQNLGWLASGGQLPRKRKPIENVSRGSLVYLEAEKAKARSEKAAVKEEDNPGRRRRGGKRKADA